MPKNSSKRPVTKKLDPAQIRGLIAVRESELAALDAGHKKMIDDFRQATAGFEQTIGMNLKRFAEINGALTALKALIDA